MTDKLKQLFKDGVINQPKEVREAINAFDWGSVCEQIGKKYLFDDAEVNNFQVETALVLLGLVDPALYIKNIENEVGTTAEEAEKIEKEAVEKIFIPISDKVNATIKEKTKDPKWDQSVDFILSGGDYSVFMDKKPPLAPPSQVGEEAVKKVNVINPTSLKDPVVKLNPTSIPPKVADIRNKFTI
ncbi:MAG TPA: hypothetical protein VJC14_00120 [Candidatus Paceibacterota bacterium]